MNDDLSGNDWSLEQNRRWLKDQWRRKGAIGVGGAFPLLSLAPEIYTVFSPPRLFQATGGSTPVTADGQTVASVINLGSDGGFFEQATAANEPVYHTSAGLHWIEGAVASHLFLTKDVDISGVALYAAAAFMPQTVEFFERLVSIAAGGLDYNNTLSAGVILRNDINESWGAYAHDSLHATAAAPNGTASVVESIFSAGEHVFSVNGVDSAPVASDHDFASTVLGLFRQAAADDAWSNARLYSLFMRVGVAPTSGERALVRTSLGATAGLIL